MVTLDRKPLTKRECADLRQNARRRHKARFVYAAIKCADLTALLDELEALRTPPSHPA